MGSRQHVSKLIRNQRLTAGCFCGAAAAADALLLFKPPLVVNTPVDHQQLLPTPEDDQPIRGQQLDALIYSHL